MDEKKDQEKRVPLRSDEQDEPVPERPLNAQEEAGESIQEMEDPPQAEGDRESAGR